jgi:hypothetical protein
MRTWNPRELACVTLIATVCIILVLIQCNIMIHPETAEQSRALLKEIITMILGLTAGFFMGKNTINK